MLRRARALWNSNGRSLGAVLVILLLWELACRLPPIQSLGLPSPEATANGLIARWQILVSHGAITGYETLVGFLVALAGGLSGAVVLSLSPRLAAALWPTILFLQIMPKVAIAPLLLLWLGFGLLPKVIIAFLISFFPILANAYAGLQSVDEETNELARSMHAAGVRYFLYFTLPQALPRILSGARIAITFAVVGAVVAEFIGADKGLGYLVILSARNLDMGLMLAAIFTLTCLGVGLYGLVSLAEHYLIPWHISRRRAEMRDLSETRATAGGL